MAGCATILTGMDITCGNVSGGITEVYLAPVADVATVTVATGKVSAITMVDTKKFVKYKFKDDTSDFKKTATVNDNAGSFVMSEIAMKFHKMDTVKRTEMQALMGSHTYAIVKDKNGIFWFVGYNSYCKVTAGTGATGTGRGDANEYTVTLAAETNEFPYEVDSTIVAALLAV